MKYRIIDEVGFFDKSDLIRVWDRCGWDTCGWDDDLVIVDDIDFENITISVVKEAAILGRGMADTRSMSEVTE